MVHLTARSLQGCKSINTVMVALHPQGTFFQGKCAALCVGHSDAYVKLIQGRSQLADARVALGLVRGRGGLSSIGDAGDGLLDLLEHVIAVGSCGGHVWVAEEGLGGRVQHRGVLLQGPSGGGHLVPTVGILQLLRVQNTHLSHPWHLPLNLEPQARTTTLNFRKHLLALGLSLAARTLYIVPFLCEIWEHPSSTLAFQLMCSIRLGPTPLPTL